MNFCFHNHYFLHVEYKILLLIIFFHNLQERRETKVLLVAPATQVSREIVVNRVSEDPQVHQDPLDLP